MCSKLTFDHVIARAIYVPQKLCICLYFGMFNLAVGLLAQPGSFDFCFLFLARCQVMLHFLPKLIVLYVATLFVFSGSCVCFKISAYVIVSQKFRSLDFPVIVLVTTIISNVDLPDFRFLPFCVKTCKTRFSKLNLDFLHKFIDLASQTVNSLLPRVRSSFHSLLFSYEFKTNYAQNSQTDVRSH